MKIQKDYSRDALFDELGLKRLRESYMIDTELSPQDRYAFVAKEFGNDDEHAQRLYNYASKHWLSFSTPILSYGRDKKSLPISCYLSNIPDTASGLVDSLSEVNWLSMVGGGVGIHVRIRSADEKSVGVMPHLKVYDAACQAYRQGKTRRGSYAPYLDISHPDILMFVDMRKPTGDGDQNYKCLNLHHGVNISDKFMKIIEQCTLDPTADDKWELINPANNEVVEVVSAKVLWQKIIEMRMTTGEPYLWFIDTANNALPSFQKSLGLRNNGSNICCVTGDTLVKISTDGGNTHVTEPVSDVTEKYEMGLYDTNTLILSRDINENVNEWQSLAGAIVSGETDELYEIESPCGKVIRCTGNHRIMTQRGYVFASELLEDDVLIVFSE